MYCCKCGETIFRGYKCQYVEEDEESQCNDIEYVCSKCFGRMRPLEKYISKHFANILTELKEGARQRGGDTYIPEVLNKHAFFLLLDSKGCSWDEYDEGKGVQIRLPDGRLILMPLYCEGEINWSYLFHSVQSVLNKLGET